MRQLFLLVLALAGTAMGANYCPTSSLNGQVSHSVTTAGASDAVSGCTVGGDATSVLTLDLSTLPAAPGAASVVTFADGTVAGVSLIRVQLPSSGDAASAIAVSVSITGTEFGAGSGIQVFGSFPPQSSLTISGNSLAVSTASQPAWFIDTFTAIALYDATLNDDSQITIADNTISGNGDLSAFKAAVGISWRGGVTYGSGVAVQIVRNSITLACQSTLNPSTDQQACVVGLHLMANQFFTGFASSLAVDGNAFAVTGGLVAAMPPVSSIGGVIGTSVSFSENTCQATTTGAVGTDAVTFGYLSYGSDAQYAIKNNSFTLVGTTACGVGFSPKIPVDQMWDGGQDPPSGFTDSSALSFTFNTIRTTGCDAQIHFGRDHQLTGNSRFLINRNALTRQDQVAASAAIQVLNSVTLQDGAALSISSNTWSGPSASGDAQLIGYAFSQTAGVTGALGSVRACGNVLQGSTLSTDAQVRGRCPDALSTIITASQCVVEDPEDTLQNTFATTTAAPTTADPTLAPTTTPTSTTPTSTSPTTAMGSSSTLTTAVPSPPQTTILTTGVPTSTQQASTADQTGSDTEFVPQTTEVSTRIPLTSEVTEDITTADIEETTTPELVENTLTTPVPTTVASGTLSKVGSFSLLTVLAFVIAQIACVF